MWWKVAEIVLGLFGKPLLRKVFGGLKKAEPYLPEIYDYVRTVAQLTPTRSDDEIMRVADMFGVPLLLEPGADKGEVLAEIVLEVARRKWPNVPERVLRRAVELAYGAVRP